jgi:hypothetical protein
MLSAKNMTIAQYLLDHEADIHYRASEETRNNNMDAPMNSRSTYRAPGVAFAFLSCNTDAKNVKIDSYESQHCHP